jgi:hypothetical protein
VFWGGGDLPGARPNVLNMGTTSLNTMSLQAIYVLLFANHNYIFIFQSMPWDDAK